MVADAGKARNDVGSSSSLVAKLKKSCIRVASDFCFISLATLINYLYKLLPKKEFDHISFQFLLTLFYVFLFNIVPW